MKNFNLSTKIYFGLVLVLALLSAISIYLPQGNLISQQQLPTSKSILAVVNFSIMLIIYGGLGYIGLRLAKKIGFAEVWDVEVSNRERFLIPTLIGVGNGIIFIIVDIIFSKINSFGYLPHPVFPTSAVASATAGIGEEIVFRLFFISFWVWLISDLLLRKKWETKIFWIVTIFSGIAFTVSHLPSIMFLTGVNSISQLSLNLIIELFIINGLLSVFAAYYFKRYGFLAAVGIHFWADIVFHVLWGLR
ncbi:CPBP family glutamic-type intramembrane protease [Halanaerobaculum tunisiense]